MTRNRSTVSLLLVLSLVACGGVAEVDRSGGYSGSGNRNGSASASGGRSNANAGAANAEQDIRESCSAFCTPSACASGFNATCMANCQKKATNVGTCLQPWLGMVDCLARQGWAPCGDLPSPAQACATEYERAKTCLGVKDPLVNESPTDMVSPAEAEGRAPIQSTPGDGTRCEDLAPVAVDECNAGGHAEARGANQCSAFCTEPSGTVWQSNCKDGECTCSRDGAAYCSCSQEPGAMECKSCCPVLPP